MNRSQASDRLARAIVIVCGVFAAGVIAFIGYVWWRARDIAHDARGNWIRCSEPYRNGAQADIGRCGPDARLRIASWLPGPGKWPAKQAIAEIRELEARLEINRAEALRPNRRARRRALRRAVAIGMDLQGEAASAGEHVTVLPIARGSEWAFFLPLAIFGNTRALRSLAVRSRHDGLFWRCLLEPGRSSPEWPRCAARLARIAHARERVGIDSLLGRSVFVRLARLAHFADLSTDVLPMELDEASNERRPAAPHVLCSTPADVLGVGDVFAASDLVDVEHFERAAAHLNAFGERAAPGVFDLWAVAAAYRIRWGDTREARADLEHAAEVARGIRRACLAPAWILLGDYDRARAWLDENETTNASPELRARTHLQRAWLLVEQNRLEEGLRMAERAFGDADAIDADQASADTDVANADAANTDVASEDVGQPARWLIAALRLRLGRHDALPENGAHGLSDSPDEWYDAAARSDREQAAFRMHALPLGITRPEAVYVQASTLRHGDREVWLDACFGPDARNWQAWFHARTEATRWLGDLATARRWEARNERLRALAGRDPMRRIFLDLAIEGPIQP